MNSIFKKIAFISLGIVGLIGLSSSILLLDDTHSNKNSGDIKTIEDSTPSSPFTSTGSFLGFYTTLPQIPPTPPPFPVDVISFNAMNGANTTLSNPWASVNFTQTDAFLPTNTSAYDPTSQELVCLISKEQQLLTYFDGPMNGNLINVAPATSTAPVYLNGTLFGIDIENGGYASGTVVDFDIIDIDPQSGLMNGIAPLQFQTNNQNYFFNQESMSSATNSIDEIYFLSGSNLIIVTNPSVSTTTFCWKDLAPSNTFNNWSHFYGLEYKSPGILLAIRETINNNLIATDLVEISFNSTTCTVNSLTSVYDIQNNLPLAPGGWYVNSEYYSSTYYPCTDAYYISSRYDHITSSRLIEIDIPGATHFEQIFPDYLFGIEWKQTPCPCVAAFAYTSVSQCGTYGFNNLSTGPAPLTYVWHFDDPGSGSNNFSLLQNPGHIFSTCGNFNVCMTVSGPGCSNTICQNIQVTDLVPPVALCKSNVVIALDANCMASLQVSDIDNGSFDNCNLQSLSIDQTMFNACGLYPVTLTATDWCGNTDVCNTIVQVVDNIPPTIICPSDVYLSTLDPTCSMIVNGLQWIALSDNCGIASVTYTVTGDTQHSGIGDVSGLSFNQGTSIVTYIATDNCGNTSQCTFKVNLTCICDCPNNLIQNSGFTDATTNFGLVDQCAFWNSVNINNYFVPVIPPHGCCDIFSLYLGHHSLWSNYNKPVAYQSGLQFLQGHHYKISFCTQSVSSPGTNVNVGFTATNSPVSVSFDPTNCSNCQAMGITGYINPLIWSNYTLPIWTPNQNWDVLSIYPIATAPTSISGFDGAASIDNICVEEVFYFCCGDEQAFIENTDIALNTRADQETWEGVFEAGNLMECNSIDYINWGDGTITDGPLLGNTTVRHAYAETGTYRVEYRIREFDPQDTSQLACFSHVFLDSIVILPDTCYCGDFSTMQFSWGPNLTQPVSCGMNPPVLLGCPSTGNGYDFTGAYFCHGTICPRQSEISWTLNGPGGFNSGIATASPYFVIPILPTYLTQPGTYTLSLSGQCGDQNCFCIIEFVVDCPDLCPCNPNDIIAFSNAVDMGFSQGSLSNSCEACFSPNALSDCETVDWHINNITPTPIATSTGNQSFCHTFPNSGSYTIIMVVNRKKPDGSDCETFVYSRQVNVLCQSWPDCNDPRIVNPNFNEGAIAGGLGYGGMITGWAAAGGVPVVTEGVIGSQDNWSVLLRGNKNYSDILETKEAICLDAGVETISLRAAANPPRRKPEGKPTLIVEFSDGLMIKTIAEIPLTNLDSSEWWEYQIPFDVSDWIGLDSCGDIPGTISAHLRISVSNALDDIQGGPLTFTEIYIDNVCMDNLVSISPPKVLEPILIYPNPVSGMLSLRLHTAATKEISIQVVNVTGQILSNNEAEPGKEIQSVDVAHLPDGLYFLQVLSNGKVLSVNKFVKM